MSNVIDNINSSDLMNMKDTDKYQRQIGSKALIMTATNEKKAYEEARNIALERKRQQDELASRVDSLEKTTSKILSILERLDETLSKTNNADT